MARSRELWLSFGIESLTRKVPVQTGCTLSESGVTLSLTSYGVVCGGLGSPERRCVLGVVGLQGIERWQTVVLIRGREQRLTPFLACCSASSGLSAAPILVYTSKLAEVHEGL